LPGGERLLDLGCGAGLTLAILAEARACTKTGAWAPGLGTPALYERMTGIDVRPRVVRIARQALADAGEIMEGEARGLVSSRYDAVLICDVLHMMAFGEQEQILDAVRSWLSEGGVVIVRVADAAGRWRFRAAAIANRLKAIVLGQWRQDFYFRTEREWLELFTKHGLAATIVANGGRMPIATVLFRLTVPVGPAIDRTPVHAA
jgi:cyclopropane fatty-acyl-phospholipid synthase-like methyltransferase